MKNLKKVMALVIVLSMVVSMFTVMTASAADFEDVIGTPYEEAVLTLAPMGVIAGYEESGVISFKPDQVVTRAEMAAFIVRQLGLSAAKTVTEFTDVPQDHWGSGAINIANKKSIVVGYGDDTFHPDEQVSFEAAVKMLVCALGYGVDAEDNGGWPAGYIAYGDKLGLLDGVEELLADTTAGCTRGTVALLLYNALDINMQEVSYYNGQVLSKTILEDTMTSEMGYEKWEDVIVAATDTAAVSGSLQDKGYVAFEGYSEDVVAGEWDMNAYLGRPVTVYVKYNKKANEYTIISVVGTSYNSEVVTLDAADIYGMDDTDLVYYVDKASSSKTAEYTLADLAIDGGDLTMVYNNKAVDQADQDYELITAATNGTITLIDSADDGVFERVIIETYQNYQVVETDVEENMLYLESTVDETEVELDDSKETNRPKFSIVDCEGAALTLADLAEDDVLSIYSDVYPTSGKDYVKDADALKIVACNHTIEGAVTSIANKKVYIDGEAYETDGVLSVNSFAIEDEGIFFLDFNGDIAFSDTAAVLDNFEFVYDGIVEGRDITLYTLNSNGDQVEYKMATTVRVDGSSYNMSQAADRNALATALKINGSEGLTDEYIVSLKTNDAGKITRITKLDGTKERGYLTHSDKLIGSYSLNADTVVFTLPANEDFDEDNLKATKYTSLSNNTSYNFKVCDVDKNGIVTCMIVYTTDGKVDLESNIAVIQSVATTKVDDEIVLSLTMIQEGKTVTKTTKTDDIFFINDTYETMYGESAAIAYGAYPGQIIMYATDTAGAISSVDRVYPRPCLAEEYEDGYYLVDEFQTWDNTFRRNDYARLFLGTGFVVEKNTNTKVMTVDSAIEDTDASFVANYGSARIVVVDTNMASDELAVKTGSAADIKAGDFVVVRKYKGTVRDIVVYKNFDAVPAFYK
ncbi:MAG: S-layer homology domain-containing protein [Ruminococcaceae bacterium]|nr:S-layer homology domain-containing protein [Oscillospiraceae bacterium]